MHRVVSSGLLAESPADAGLFSLDRAVQKLLSVPRLVFNAYRDDEVWEALWQATLQTYQGVRPQRAWTRGPARVRLGW